MANVFDQFDEAPVATAEAPKANPFDQFDEQPTARTNPFDQFDSKPQAEANTQASLLNTDFSKAASASSSVVEKPFLSGGELKQIGPTGEVAPSNPTALPIETDRTSNTLDAPIVQLPNVSEDQVRKSMEDYIGGGYLGEKPKFTDAEVKQATGVARGIQQTAQGLTSPANIALMVGTGGAPAIVQKGVALYFAGQMAKQVPQQLAQAEATEDPTEKAQVYTEAALNGLMATLAFGHANGRIREIPKLASGSSPEQINEAIKSAPEPHKNAEIPDEMLDGMVAARDAAEKAASAAPNNETLAKLNGALDRQLSDVPPGRLYEARSRLASNSEAMSAEPASAAVETPHLLDTEEFKKKAAENAAAGDPAPLTAAAAELTAPELPSETNSAPTEAPLNEPSYVGGPGAMSPVEASEMAAKQQSTGLKRSVVDTERLSRGAEEIPTPERQREEQVVQQAEDKIDSDPTAAPSLVSRIVDDGVKSITEHDAATLLVERQKLMNERRAWEEKIGNGEDVESGKSRLGEIEGELDRLDRAQRSAGTTWGRLGHMYQRLIREDFTLESMESKMRAATGEKLTPEQSAKIREQSTKIKELQDKLDAAKGSAESASIDSEVSRLYEATINELGKSYLDKPSYGKQVFDIARQVVDRWKSEVDEASKTVKDWLGAEGGGVGGVGGGKGGGRKLGQQNNAAQQNVIVAIAKIVRAKIGEFGLSKAEATAELISEFGPKIKPLINGAWDKAQELIRTEKIPDKVKETAKKGVSKKGEKTPVEAKATAKAESVAQEPLSNKTVYDLARAHINAGVHGENPVMAAVFKDLKEFYPGLTERDVRRAYSDYGKAQFPSQDAVKKEMREIRALTRMQESIDRLTEGRDAMRTGAQRDKATQAIREKQKQLNELLKQRQGPPTKEQLATRDEAKQTALRNAIADLDKQLRTGEKPPTTTPVPDSPQVEQLRAERDAMRAKLKEIEEEAKIRPTDEEAYNARRLKDVQKRTQELQAKIDAGDFTRKAKPVTPQKTREVKDAEFALDRKKQEFNKGLFEEDLKKRSAGEKSFDFIRDVLNTSRALMTSFDLSAVLRQGGFISLAHPIRAAKAFPAMFKAFASEKGQFEVNDEIQSRSNSELYKQSKLFLNDPHDYRLSKMEEQYMTRWAAKIPGVAHSERAYVTFLNKLRADSFDSMADAVGNGKPISPEEGKAIANFVNVATGRGNLAGTAGGAIALNTAFFSPRFVVSRFELLAGQPLYRGTAATRIAVAKEYARYLTALGVIYGLSKMSGGTVETDPRSSDFGKVRFGNTRVDLLSGLAQATVLESRMISGQTKTPSGQVKSIRGKLPFGQPDSADVAGRFLRTKLSPTIGSAVDVSAGSDVMGNPVTPAIAAQRMLVPLSFGDVYSALQDQGVDKGTAIALLALLGAGVQVQKPKASPNQLSGK